MSIKTVVKIALDAEANMKFKDTVMFMTASIVKANLVPTGSVTYSWSDNDWSTLGWDDLMDFDEFMDADDLADGASYQYVCLAADDNYMVISGEPEYGIRVDFCEDSL